MIAQGMHVAPLRICTQDNTHGFFKASKPECNFRATTRTGTAGFAGLGIDENPIRRGVLHAGTRGDATHIDLIVGRIRADDDPAGASAPRHGVAPRASRVAAFVIAILVGSFAFMLYDLAKYKTRARPDRGASEGGMASQCCRCCADAGSEHGRLARGFAAGECHQSDRGEEESEKAFHILRISLPRFRRATRGDWLYRGPAITPIRASRAPHTPFFPIAKAGSGA